MHTDQPSTANPADPANPDVSVVVVGAGPAGLATAISLARHGTRVLVVERHSGTSIFPRATAVSTRSMEILRSWGLEDRVRPGGMDIRPMMSISAALNDQRHAVVPMGYPSDEAALAVSPTTPCWCPQDHLEPVLADHLVSQGGELRFGTEVVEFEQDEDAVRVVLRERATGAESVVRTDFLVAADGARSSIRSTLGVAMEGPPNLGNYVTALFHADLSALIGERACALYRIEGSQAQGVFLPTSRNHRWVYGQQWNPELGESVEDYTVDRLVGMIRTAAGVPDLGPKIFATQSFEFAAQVAATVQVGRVFLIGDAAHRMTPVGGMGLNTAIGDGHNLGWKLAWVVNGWAGPALLDTYSAERRPVGLHNTVRSMGTTEQAQSDGLAEDLGIVYRSAAVVAERADLDDSNPTDTAESAATPGARSPHVWLGFDGRRVSTLDLFDGRFTLLSGRAGRWVLPDSRSLPLVTMTCGQDFVDIGGTFHEAFGIGPEGAVLVRPDGHIAWRCSDPDAGALAELVDAFHRCLDRSDSHALAAQG